MKDQVTRRRHGRWVVAAVVASVIVGPAASLLADTLVLRDGRQVTGEVERIDGGYRVKTATGVVQVSRSDVAEWKRSTDAPATPAAPAPSTATPGTAVPKPALAKPTTAPSNVADRKARTVEVLLTHGSDAIALGDFKAARDLLVDAYQVDPRSRPVLEALGYTYVKLEDIPRAMRSLEAAVVGNATPSREVTLNLAYALLRSRNPMRGAKMIKDYLAANSAKLDEEALNAFAICLGQSSEESRVNKFWTECVSFYEQYNAKLEATKPGQKRWGINWVSQSEFAVHDSKNKAIQAQMDTKWTRLEAARKEFYRVKRSYEDAVAASRFKKSSVSGASESQVRAAKETADTLQREYNDLASRLIRPPLPDKFEPVAMEFGSGAMLASAGGTGTTGSAGVGSMSPGLRPDPEPATPPVAVQPKPPTVQPPTPKPATIQPPSVGQNTVTPPVDPPVAVTPPTPRPSPSDRTDSRKRSIFTSSCGFAVGPDLIVTSAASVEGTTRITVQPADSDPIDAELVRTDAASGLALVRLKNYKMAYLPVADAFAGGTLQCVSYPTVSIFESASEVIGGSSVPPKDGWAIRLNKHPRLAGGPIIAGGKVVGVCLASRDNDSSTLPSATLGTLKTFIGALPPSPTVSDPTIAVVMVNGVKER